jgi:hypothetical protein
VGFKMSQIANLKLVERSYTFKHFFTSSVVKISDTSIIQKFQLLNTIEIRQSLIDLICKSIKKLLCITFIVFMKINITGDR